jgi:hypothetical protein
MTDELADVDLRGRALVSDNPADWVIPAGMARADSVYEWWVRLHQVELIATPELVHACKGVIAAYRTQGPWWQRTILSHARTMMALGMTFEQIEEATGVPVRRNIDKKLLDGLDALRNGVPLEEVQKGLSVGNQRQMTSLARVLSGEAKPLPLVRRRPEIKEFALRQWAEGIDRHTIVRNIEERFGEKVKPDAVSQWIFRDKERKAKAS